MKKKLIAALLALSLIAPCATAETVSPQAEAPAYDALFAEYTAAYQALDGVLGAQIGTAGSSLKCAIAACGLLDWAQELPEEACLREEILSWWMGLTEDKQATLDECLEAVLEQADAIAADFAGAKDLLESAGNPQTHEGYDPDKWQVVRDELTGFAAWKDSLTNDTKE